MGRPNATVRGEVWERDEGICGLCGKPVDPDDWNLDHIIPRALGGDGTADNLRVAHPTCNRRRTDPRLMTDAEIAEAADDYAAEVFSLDKYATFEEAAGALLERPSPA